MRRSLVKAQHILKSQTTYNIQVTGSYEPKDKVQQFWIFKNDKPIIKSNNCMNGIGNHALWQAHVQAEFFIPMGCTGGCKVIV